MKKIITCCLAVALTLTMIVPAMAAEETMPETVDVSSVEYYAYMDLDTADAALKETILEARNEIIFSTSWVVDGGYACVKDPDGNIVSIAPQFSELFPAEWEPPVFPTDSAETPSTNSVQDLGEINFVGYVDLTAPPANTNTPPFTSVFTNWAKVTTFGANFYVDNTTFHCGYSNYHTGASLGYQPYIPSGYSYEMNVPSAVTICSVRASTSDTPSSWYMTVFVDNEGY